MRRPTSHRPRPRPAHPRRHAADRRRKLSRQSCFPPKAANRSAARFFNVSRFFKRHYGYLLALGSGGDTVFCGGGSGDPQNTGEPMEITWTSERVERLNQLFEEG